MCAFTGSAQATDQATAQATGLANNQTILTFVRHYEARGNYNSYYAGIRTAPPKPLTQMTVGAVMAWQAGLIKPRSTAAGGYQIIKATLAKLVKKHRIDRKALFDPAMQDRLGALLIANCQDRNNTPVFANCLAGIWPALPRVSGPDRGRSRYHGVAGNKVLTTPGNLLAMLEGQPFNLRTLAPYCLGRACMQAPSDWQGQTDFSSMECSASPMSPRGRERCRSNSAAPTTGETAPC